jgi:hypothetical protein
MGLDMYVYATKQAPKTEVDFEDVEIVSEVHQWRKHPNLHGWMRKLYREKGGKSDEFNCDSCLLLTAADLDRLEQDIKADRLPATNGFFFGHTDGSEFDDDLYFIDKARLAFARGWSIYYTSWW